MNESVRINDSVACEIVRAKPATRPGMGDGLIHHGRFTVELWRKGKRIAEWQFNNQVTTEGKNKLYSAMFKSGTQVATWYVSLISSTGYTALAVGDTYANIGQAGNQWTEFTTYTDDANGQSSTTRPTLALNTPMPEVSLPRRQRCLTSRPAGRSRALLSSAARTVRRRRTTRPATRFGRRVCSPAAIRQSTSATN